MRNSKAFQLFLLSLPTFLSSTCFGGIGDWFRVGIQEPPLPSSSTEDCCFRNVTDTFNPDLDCGDRVWIRADLLYFLPKVKRLSLTNQMTDLFSTADVTLQPRVKPHFEWDFGYRLGMGYGFACSPWDMTVNWTHFDARAHQSKSNDGNIQLGMFPIWSLGSDILQYDYVANASSHWKLKLNLIDLDFGRIFSFCETFFLRPYAGLRAALIDQKFKVQYGGGIFLTGLDLFDLDSTFGKDNIRMKNDFIGVGPQLGLEPQINLGKGLRLYGNVCGTMSYGWFDVHQREVFLSTVRYNKSHHPHGIRWMLDAGAGLMWRTFVACERFALSFSLGWEYHIFFHQVELRTGNFDLVSDDKNLSLNGAAFSARFDF